MSAHMRQCMYVSQQDVTPHDTLHGVLLAPVKAEWVSTCADSPTPAS